MNFKIHIYIDNNFPLEKEQHKHLCLNNITIYLDRKSKEKLKEGKINK